MFEEYDLTWEEAKEYMLNADSQRVRDEIKKIIGDGSVLDLGCGRGISAGRYKPDRYIGLDIGEQLIEVAKRQNPKHRFINGDAMDTQFPNKYFDYVIIKSVLEHTPSEEIAQEIFKEAMFVGKTVLVAWHTPPNYDKTQIINVEGHNKKTIYQNHFRKDLLDGLYNKIEKRKVDNFELWICV